MGGFEPAGPRKTGRWRSEVTPQRFACQLSRTLLTLVVAPAAEVNVGLMALSERTPVGGDRLQALQSRFKDRTGVSRVLPAPTKAAIPPPWRWMPLRNTQVDDNYRQSSSGGAEVRSMLLSFPVMPQLKSQASFTVPAALTVDVSVLT
jgi:hypothetical protein